MEHERRQWIGLEECGVSTEGEVRRIRRIVLD
jgi:hypothetical protein